MKKIIFLFYLFFPLLLFGQSFEVKNVHFKPMDKTVEIYYDLEGDADSYYEITIKLRRENIPEFEFIPNHLDGDIGTGKFAGFSRRIIWNFFLERGNSFEGDDYYFEISAEKYERGGFPWLTVGGGSVLAGVAFLIYKIISKPEGTKSIPLPPGRPQVSQ